MSGDPAAAGGGPPPARVRVTSPRTAATARRTVASEIDDQTELGAVYLRSLIRAQLRLAAGVLLVVALGAGGLPLLFRLAPELSRHRVLGMPLAWGLLAFVVYPLMVGLGWAFVRRAEGHERTFADMVGEPEPPGPGARR